MDNKKNNELKNEKETNKIKYSIEAKKDEKEKKEEKAKIKNKEEETGGRPHYVFYYLPFKKPNNTEGNTLDSISYYNGKARPNYKFVCSFGPPQNSPKKNIKTDNNKNKNSNNNIKIKIDNYKYSNSNINAKIDNSKNKYSNSSINAKIDNNKNKYSNSNINAKIDNNKNKYSNSNINAIIDNNKNKNNNNNLKAKIINNKSKNSNNSINVKFDNNKNINNNSNINLPIGIASTLYNSPKKFTINVIPPRTEDKTPKVTNIFKPVPKNIIQTSKIQSGYQPRKYDYKQQINNTSANKSKNYRIISPYQIKDKNKLKYYARCPNCNFPLNDENEIKKYYSKDHYNISSNYLLNNNTNRRSKPYETKKFKKIEKKEGSKYNIRTNNDSTNYRKYFFSPTKSEVSENYLFRNSVQTSINSSNQSSNLVSPRRNHNYYQSIGTSSKNKNMNKRF